MKDTSLLPLRGINLVAEDSALQRGGDSPSLFVRDAVNVDITPGGKAMLRPSGRRITATAYKNLWQSPLHGDTFATVDDTLVKVDTVSWEAIELATVGKGDISFDVLNNHICVAAPAGIFEFDGVAARKLTIDEPAPPLVITDEGSMGAGRYGVAVAWLRGEKESNLSPATFADLGEAGALDITFPYCMDSTVTGIRLYLTNPNGGEFLRGEDYPIITTGVRIMLLPELGRAAQFQFLEKMPTGRYVKYWRGRLLTTRLNVLRWSEALAYHLHNPRHGFVQFAQRITFVQPVDGGIWVGQRDHVVFLQGTDPDSLQMSRRASKAPVAGSSLLAPAELVGEASSGGSPVALWLAENGYVMGTSNGQLIEPHANVLTGITSAGGTSVVLERRVITAVQ